MRTWRCIWAKNYLWISSSVFPLSKNQENKFTHLASPRLQPYDTARTKKPSNWAHVSNRHPYRKRFLLCFIYKSTSTYKQPQTTSHHLQQHIHPRQDIKVPMNGNTTQSPTKHTIDGPIRTVAADEDLHCELATSKRWSRTTTYHGLQGDALQEGQSAATARS